MDWNRGSDRIISADDVDACRGQVRWRASKSIWIGTMTAVGLVGGLVAHEFSAMLVFALGSALTLCAGHSVGMHRRLIHNSFECPLWLEYLCVYLGVLVGMAGPIGMIHQHDLRDWAQRRPRCHDYLRHGQNFWMDAWWQLHCELQLECGPKLRLEERIQHSRFYRWLERTWMWQQLPWTLLFFYIGGWSWVCWGICLRIAVCVTGHWLVGHFAHRRGPMNWKVEGAGVQGHDVPIAAWVSMGESWHNNHHAYPGSARLGLLSGQADPGWWLIKVFERCGLAWSIKTPGNLAPRPALRRLWSGAEVTDSAAHFERARGD